MTRWVFPPVQKFSEYLLIVACQKGRRVVVQEHCVFSLALRGIYFYV